MHYSKAKKASTELNKKQPVSGLASNEFFWIVDKSIWSGKKTEVTYHY